MACDCRPFFLCVGFRYRGNRGFRYRGKDYLCRTGVLYIKTATATLFLLLVALGQTPSILYSIQYSIMG